MSKTKKEYLMDIYLAEYDKLKHEQTQRIGFRDNLIYANLIAITGITSVAISSAEAFPVLLITPLASVTLGWIYLNNDYKISLIGRYIKNELNEKISQSITVKEDLIFKWENISAGDPKRKTRKVIQLIIDEFNFVLPGLLAVLIYWHYGEKTLRYFSLLEIPFLAILFFQIFIYAEFKK